MGKYPAGTEVALVLEFTAPPPDDPEGLRAPHDPETITLQLTQPDGTTTTYTYPGSIVRRMVGSYYCKHVASQRGIYAYSVQATGVRAANKGYFETY